MKSPVKSPEKSLEESTVKRPIHVSKERPTHAFTVISDITTATEILHKTAKLHAQQQQQQQQQIQHVQHEQQRLSEHVLQQQQQQQQAPAPTPTPLMQMLSPPGVFTLYTLN